MWSHLAVDVADESLCLLSREPAHGMVVIVSGSVAVYVPNDDVGKHTAIVSTYGTFIGVLKRG